MASCSTENGDPTSSAADSAAVDCEGLKEQLLVRASGSPSASDQQAASPGEFEMKFEVCGF